MMMLTMMLLKPDTFHSIGLVNAISNSTKTCKGNKGEELDCSTSLWLYLLLRLAENAKQTQQSFVQGCSPRKEWVGARTI